MAAVFAQLCSTGRKECFDANRTEIGAVEAKILGFKVSESG